MYTGSSEEKVNLSAEINRVMSRDGAASRLLGEDQDGRIAKILIGWGPGSRVLSFERQPDHEEKAYIQEARFRHELLGKTPEHLRGIANIAHRPTGERQQVPLEAAHLILWAAYLEGSNEALPARSLALVCAGISIPNRNLSL